MSDALALFCCDLGATTVSYQIVIFNGDCSYGLSYIGETKHNSEVKRDSNPTKSSEPAKHLRGKIGHFLHRPSGLDKSRTCVRYVLEITNFANRST